MTRFATTAAIAAIAASMGTAHATTTGLTPTDVDALKKAWGEGIVEIGAVHAEGGDYRAAASEHIERFYAYDEADVLFKPTLASEEQFRGSFDEALSYFVGGDIAEDDGFAIAPYENVRWEPEGTVVSGDTAMSMGNYYFERPDGSEVKVEYTFGIVATEDGTPKIVLHHSSLPYAPS